MKKLIIGLLFISNIISAQKNNIKTLESMVLEQKIAMLFCVNSFEEKLFLENFGVRPGFVLGKKSEAINPQTLYLRDIFPGDTLLSTGNRPIILPQSEALKVVRNKEIEKQLVGFWASLAGEFDGVLMNDTSGYLVGEGEKSWSGVKGFACFKIQPKDSLSGTNLPLFYVPVMLRRALVPHSMSHPDSIMTDSVKIKNVNDVELDIPTVEGVLEQKGVFYSLSAENDFLFIRNLFAKQLLPIDLLNQACLAAMYRKDAISNSNTSGLISDKQQMWIKQFYNGTISVAKNENALLPLMKLDSLKIGVIGQNISQYQNFIHRAKKYSAISTFEINSNNEIEQIQNLNNCNTVILLLSSDNQFNLEKLLGNLYLKNKSLIICSFGENNREIKTSSAKKIDALIVAGTNQQEHQETAASLIFGGATSTGIIRNSTLGVEANTQLNLSETIRFSYGYPSEVGMNSEKLKTIDEIAQKAIDAGATPGCQILVARKGKIIYEKAFGNTSYTNGTTATDTTLYDIASVTKIMASASGLMKLADEKKIDIEQPLSQYLTDLKGSNKEDTKIRDILLHQAGLHAFIPFYLNLIDTTGFNQPKFSYKKSDIYSIQIDSKLYFNKNAKYRPDIFKTKDTTGFNVKVADSLYILNSYRDSMFKQIVEDKLRTKRNYLYSDMGYYLFQRLIENDAHEGLDSTFDKDFAKPLGAWSLCYNPLERFTKPNIAPTENDEAFRRQLLCGYVHDPGAAMMGGVAGHAGLFSNANDLAKMMQLYLNKGVYGGQRFISDSTLTLFTQYHTEGNRRGLAFDKPELDPKKANPVCGEASPKSFGHSGFTGTLVWADPKYDLVFVFLSNRINPQVFNKKLTNMNIRGDIMQAVYLSIEKE